MCFISVMRMQILRWSLICVIHKWGHKMPMYIHVPPIRRRIDTSLNDSLYTKHRIFLCATCTIHVDDLDIHNIRAYTYNVCRGVWRGGRGGRAQGRKKQGGVLMLTTANQKRWQPRCIGFYGWAAYTTHSNGIDFCNLENQSVVEVAHANGILSFAEAKRSRRQRFTMTSNQNWCKPGSIGCCV